ncbi:MAG TPA: hypothetical protein VGQ09_12280 [Chitinophagaceae bacterium]|jgi:predicted transcriptional regulator YdeE|nr:hypothetical protein [Chitinophagaceae bacterium]
MMTIEKHVIDKDIKVACLKASSFPEGIEAAHEKLHALLPNSEQRTFYGISYPDKNGKIIYWAAAKELHEGEAKNLKLETFVIRKGEYASEYLEDWRRDVKLVDKTFEKLLSDPRIDSKGYCLEVYVNANDMQCMVPLETSH